jgi:hypothetical protein
MTRRSALISRCHAVALCACLLTASALPAFAHHSFAAYDKTKIVNLKGTVKSFQWVNPHVQILVYVEPPGGGAPETWVVETTSPGVLTRSGWVRSSLKPGDRVSVDLNPLRDGSHGGGLDKITLLETGQVLTVTFASEDQPDKP